jgi:hypothetical protein
VGPPRAIEKLASTLYVLFVVLIVADIVAIGVALHRKSLFDRILGSADFTSQEVESSTDVYESVGLFRSAVFIAIIVVWLVWFYRARVNAGRYGVQLRHTKGWAVAAWFVPILNLFRPMEITDDIVRASDPAVPLTQQSVVDVAKHPLVVVWWVVWLVDSVLGEAWLTAQTNEDETAQPRLLLTEAALTLVDVAAAALAILVVRLITARQEQKNVIAGRPAAWTAPPPELGSAVEPA